MKKLVAIVSFLACFTLSYSDLKYEDVDKNHWAYKSIEKLVNMGIIKEDSFNFEGNKPITRYEFAVELSNVIDTIDIEKANKKELEILETLVVDFSDELNKIGFDAKTFEERVENIEKEIKRLNNVIEENKKIIEKLEERIKVLEKELDI